MKTLMKCDGYYSVFETSYHDSLPKLAPLLYPSSSYKFTPFPTTFLSSHFSLPIIQYHLGLALNLPIILKTSSKFQVPTMVPSEIRGIHYLSQENPFLIPPNFGLLQSDIPNFHLNTLLSSVPNCNFLSVSHDQFVAPPSSCLSSNSTSDEADEIQFNIIDERKHRRMISNRESARRSRMRKQKHLDELWSQVVRLRTENHNLIDKLNHVSESHDRVLQENARLKEEASDLRQMLADMQIGTSPFPCSIADFDDLPCNTSQLNPDPSNQTITPADMIHE
ncbi:hypothetical protein RJT34_07075 [Clitoria ternatea]|uniref:BZIP domain-containing protein n=1 Tax=Clitoria ternatea TaxID=43366 RepID=A0AAN9PUN1_CLITE